MRTLTQPLNMSPGGIPPVIHVSQYDSDFTIVFNLFSTVGDFTIESGTTAMVRGTKSSGTGYSADAVINISAKTVTVTGNAQMTAAAGQNVFEITLLKSGKEISSKNFVLLCERAALDADTITDESVLKELNAIIESADTATQAAEEAEDAADRAEAAAQTLVIDSTPTQGSSNAVSSGGVYNALQSAGLSEGVKTALLSCFRHVAWTDEHGQDYYNALASALYSETYPKIVADFNPGVNVIYTDDELNTLKQYLTVKYYANAGDSGTTIPANNYTLSGMLTAGTSTILVAYNNLTAVFTINGVVDFYNLWNWSMANGDFEKIQKSSIDFMGTSVQWGYGIDLNYGTVENRRAYGVRKGILPYVDHAEPHAELGYFPIPVPKTANKATISITPNTQFAYTQVVYIDGGRYKRRLEKGWTQGGPTITFEAGENTFLFFNTKYDSASSSYPTEPTEISVIFEEV